MKTFLNLFSKCEDKPKDSLETMEMINQEKYVSRNGVSRDLLQVVAKFGLAEVRPHINSAKNKGELHDILMQAIEWVEKGTFAGLENVNQSPNLKMGPGYQSFEKAWAQLKACVGLPPNRFKNKYQLVLDSITFIEADIMRRLVLGNFDIENIKVIYNVAQPAEIKKVVEAVEEVKEVVEVVDGDLQENKSTELPQVVGDVSLLQSNVEGERVNVAKETQVEIPKKRGRKKKTLTE